MSLLRRLARALDTTSQRQLDQRSLFGALGEEYASRFLEGPGIVSRVINPILPISDGRKNPPEADFLVYTRGNLFCIEVKHYKGRITEGFDGTTILQEKTGNYGERLAPKSHPHPLRTTKAFIRHLKSYLGEMVDTRFRTLFIYAVAAFVESADIRTIHNLDTGIIYVQELPDFFQNHTNLDFTRNPSRWIAEGIQQIPTSDLIVTTGEHPFKGFLTDHLLTFKKRDGTIERLAYSEIRSIHLQRTGLFSDYDQMTVLFSNERFREFDCASGDIHFTNFSGERQVHKLRNVNKVVVGRANKILHLR
jgi:Nuclease-related domain